MLKTSISYHASVERLDRLASCIEKLGLSDNFALEVEDKERNNGTTKCLTTTGIVIVRNTENGNIVTGYMATVAQACKMYKMAGYERMPNGMYKRVKKNNEKFPELLKKQLDFSKKICYNSYTKIREELIKMIENYLKKTFEYYGLDSRIADMLSGCDANELLCISRELKNYSEIQEKKKRQEEICQSIRQFFEDYPDDILRIDLENEDKDIFANKAYTSRCEGIIKEHGVALCIKKVSFE